MVSDTYTCASKFGVHWHVKFLHIYDSKDYPDYPNAWEPSIRVVADYVIFEERLGMAQVYENEVFWLPMSCKPTNDLKKRLILDRKAESL